MFDTIVAELNDTDCITKLVPERESPTKGRIYFQFITDDTVDPKLKGFQPRNSVIAVEDGNITEFDVRLGNWVPSNADNTMEKIKTAARDAARQTYISITQIDRGGGGGFTPHVRFWEGEVATGAFTEYLSLLATETKFLQDHG